MITADRTERIRIGLDARTMLSPRPRGTGRTLLDAWRLLPRLRPEWRFVLYHRREPPATVAELLSLPNVAARRIDIPGDRLDLWFQLRLPLAAWRDGIDLLHLPANAAPLWRPVPTIVTIHDLIPLTAAGENTVADQRAFRRGVRNAVRGAARIITPSAATRDELTRLFRVDPEKISVIPWAADRGISRALESGDIDVADVAARHGLRPPWLLNFSGSSRRKNAAKLLEAFALLSPEIRGRTQFVLTGVESASLRRRLEDQARRLGVSADCRFLGYAPHDDLPGLLRGAAAVVMPSLGEGFGLPILDAFAGGAPVLTSDLSSMPEVAGDAAVYCNPHSAASIADGVRRVLDGTTAAALRVAGAARLRDFTWERTARRMCDAYELCLRGRGLDENRKAARAKTRGSSSLCSTTAHRPRTVPRPETIPSSKTARQSARPLRVLVVAAGEPWPLNHGGRLRLFNFVKQLASRADVTLALPTAARHASELPPNVRVAIMSSAGEVTAPTRAGPKATTWIGRRARRHFGHNPAIDAWLARNARPERFDAALFSGAVLGMHVSSARIPVVWDCVDELTLYTMRDVQFGSWRRWPVALRRAAQYALYERDTAQQAAVSVFASSVDAACARRWIGAARTETITNGVDTEYFHASETPPTPGAVVFVGSLEFPPNIDAAVHFARRVWPEVYKRDGHRRLFIVGRRPTAAVRALAGAPGVEIADDVPDVRSYLAQACAAIVPTRQGGGVKNKILEACACRRPVVASSRALAGLDARVGVDVLRADQPHEWTRRLDRLLTTPALASRVAGAGYAWVRRTHRWPALGERLYELLQESAQGAPTGLSKNTAYAALESRGNDVDACILADREQHCTAAISGYDSTGEAEPKCEEALCR